MVAAGIVGVRDDGMKGGKFGMKENGWGVDTGCEG